MKCHEVQHPRKYAGYCINRQMYCYVMCAIDTCSVCTGYRLMVILLWHLRRVKLRLCGKFHRGFETVSKDRLAAQDNYLSSFLRVIQMSCIFDMFIYFSPLEWSCVMLICVLTRGFYYFCWQGLGEIIKNIHFKMSKNVHLRFENYEQIYPTMICSLLDFW